MQDLNWRNTDQFLMPVSKEVSAKRMYDLYPTLKIEDGKVQEGFESLALQLKDEKQLVIDGYIGVFFNDFRENLDAEFRKLGKKASWQSVDEALRPEELIDQMIEPFLGGDDPIFGKRTTLQLADFYEAAKRQSMKPEPQADISILLGCGATLAGWNGLFLYIDLPKNELQFRARAMAATNLGASQPIDIKHMYKRYYFIDWVVLNRYKQQILSTIDIIVDGQRPD